MEKEGSVIGHSDTGWNVGIGGQRLHQRPGGLGRIIGVSDRAGKDVGRTARQGSDPAILVEDAVHNLVDRAVAAECDDGVGASAGSAMGKANRLPFSGGFDHVDLVVGRQGFLDQDHRSAGYRGGHGVNNKCNSHLSSVPLYSVSPTIRGMKVVVCVKQIPDPADPGALDPDTKTLKRDVKLILDESDSYGVEMALQLVDTAGEGSVHLVSMAPNSERSGLSTALAMGADSATLVSDPELVGSDALGTAKVLAAAISAQEADLIIAGSESSDGYTGTVPAQIAGVLGLPAVTAAKSIEVDGDGVKIKRQTDSGFDDVECPMPCVVSVTAGVVEPRYPSFKGIMAAKSKPVEIQTAADLGFDADAVGWDGAGQEIVEISEAAQREAGEVIEDDGEGHLRIIEFLEGLKVI